MAKPEKLRFEYDTNLYFKTDKGGIVGILDLDNGVFSGTVNESAKIFFKEIEHLINKKKNEDIDEFLRIFKNIYYDSCFSALTKNSKDDILAVLEKYNEV